MSNDNLILSTCGCCVECSEEHGLNVINTSGLSALVYRVGTHSSFKAAMLRELSKKQALSKLTSRYDNDMSIATIDAWATVLDVLTFYQERIINEGYLRTATERLSVLQMARHISYIPGTGVAAGAFLSFSMNEAPGAPAKAKVPIGTKIQSIPEQDELPQVFETIEEIEAKVEWNRIPVQTTQKLIPAVGSTEIYLSGINTGLIPGDAILMIGKERADDSTSDLWDFRKVKEVLPDTDAGHTRITWVRELGKTEAGVQAQPAKKEFKFYALRQRAFLFGYNAPDWRSFSNEVRNRFLAGGSGSETNLDPEWANLDIQSISATDCINLDALYPKIAKNSWVIISIENDAEVYSVKENVESSCKGFTLASKSTSLELVGEHLSKFDTHVRDAVIFGQSEQLEIADTPVTNAIKNNKEVTLQYLVPDLVAGKYIILSGKRKRIQIPESANGLFQFKVSDNPTGTRFLKTDDSLIIVKQPETITGGLKWTLLDEGGLEGYIEVKGMQLEPVSSEKDDPMVSELHLIESIVAGADPTVIILEELISNVFDTNTLVVYANVAKATHGETRKETLGSGNGSQLFQKFELKQRPLTYISAASTTGTETTLQVRVNDILWKEVKTFYSTGPKDKIYTVHIDDDGKVTIMFGDGITGARLPTGTENVKATYRVGIGTGGSVNAGQLSMLITPVLGVSKVINPLAASGAGDPETLDKARQNAPLTVLTLDRIVSAKDFEDFTNAFAGIAKARAEILWSGEMQVVHITIATEDKLLVDKTSDFYANLVKAIKDAVGHSNQVILVDNYIPKSFTVTVKIKIDSTYLFESVQAAVNNALKESFSFESRDFGQDVTPAEVIAVVQKVKGVIYADLQALDGTDPFTVLHYRLSAGVARWQGNTIIPAELLTINETSITITEITV